MKELGGTNGLSRRDFLRSGLVFGVGAQALSSGYAAVPDVFARAVLSAIDPRTTLLSLLAPTDLPPRVLVAARAIRVANGLSFKADVNGVSDDLVLREYADNLIERSRPSVQSNVFATWTRPSTNVIGNLFWYQDLTTLRSVELNRLPDLRFLQARQPMSYLNEARPNSSAIAPLRCPRRISSHLTSASSTINV